MPRTQGRSRKSRYIEQARRAAARYGVPVRLFLSMIEHESGWNPVAVSSAGAVGLGQLMPGTARGLGVDPFEPLDNLDASAKYLSQQHGRFGNWRDALRAYNVGPNGADDPSAGAEYADRVLAGRSRYRRVPRAGRGALGMDTGGRGYGRDSLLDYLFDEPAPGESFASQVLDIRRGPTTAPRPAADFHPSEGTRKIRFRGKTLVLPQNPVGTHETSGLGWGTKTAQDIMGSPGTPLGAPEAGTIVYFHPTGAQGGGSMLFRTDSGREYWIGHIDSNAQPGKRYRRGEVIATISADHPRPHVHIDRRD